MRHFLAFLFSITALPAQTLTIVSGNGQIVQEQFLSTVPFVVQAADASGKPVAGANVNWTVTQGAGTIEGPPTVQTDANGQAGITFLATGVPPGSSYAPITLTASTGSSTVNFVLVTVLSRLPAGGYAAPPQGQLIAPTPGGTLTGSAGSTLPAALQILVTALSGAQAGQPVPNVGVRIRPPTDPAQPSATCNAPAGIVLTDARGIATCDLVLGPKTGSTPIAAIIGESQTTPTFTLTVTPGVACTYTVAPATQAFAANGGAGLVNITTASGCAWTATSSQPWILAAQATGTGSGVLNYLISANAGAARSGTLTIAGQTLTISQSGTTGTLPLTITTGANLPSAIIGTAYAATLAASGGSGSYQWTALGSLPPGLNLSQAGGISGAPTTSGTYSFNVSVVDTVTGTSQTQQFTIAVIASNGQLTITNGSFPNGSIGQAYRQVLTSTLGCTTPFSLVPAFHLISGTLPPGLALVQNSDNSFAIAGTPTTAGSYPFSLSVTDACGASGSGNFSIVISNTGPTTQQLTVTPASLQFTPSTPTQFLALNGATTFAYTATASTATGGNWIALTNASGTTPASVGVALANISQLAAGTYTGSVTITSSATNSPVIVPVTLTIPPQQNSFVITPASLSVTVPNSGNTILQAALTIGSSGAQIPFTTIAFTNSGASWLSVSPNSGTTPGIITATVNGAGLPPGSYGGTISVSAGSIQQSIPVSITVTPGSSLFVSPTTLTFSSSAPQTLTLNSTPSGVSFTATVSTVSGGNWLNVSPSTGTTPATLSVSVNPNGLAAGIYSGLISIIPADPVLPVINVPITVNVTPSAPTIASITNAASFAPGPIAPGELLSIFGSQLGSRVLFDGIAAPVLYVSPIQVSVVAPYGITGHASTTVQVDNGGILSNALTIRVVAASPAVFKDASGQGAILNQDGGINSNSNPAVAGSVVSLYATGAGQTNPGGIDGQTIGSDVLPVPLLPVTVQIGGIDAPVLYAGGAPGLISGLLQVNVRIPDNAPRGAAVPIVIFVGGQGSAPVNIAVR